MISRAKIIKALFIVEKVELNHTEKMYVKNVIQSIIDAMKVNGVDYRLKKRLEDSYHYLTKMLIQSGDKPFQLGSRDS